MGTLGPSARGGIAGPPCGHASDCRSWPRAAEPFLPGRLGSDPDPAAGGCRSPGPAGDDLHATRGAECVVDRRLACVLVRLSCEHERLAGAGADFHRGCVEGRHPAAIQLSQYAARGDRAVASRHAAAECAHGSARGCGRMGGQCASRASLQGLPARHGHHAGHVPARAGIYEALLHTQVYLFCLSVAADPERGCHRVLSRKFRAPTTGCGTGQRPADGGLDVCFGGLRCPAPDRDRQRAGDLSHGLQGRKDRPVLYPQGFSQSGGVCKCQPGPERYCYFYGI